MLRLTSLVVSLLFCGLLACEPVFAQMKNPPAPLREEPAPDSSCVRGGDGINDWLCNGDPDAEALTTEEQAMIDFIEQRHPRYDIPHDGHSVDLDAILPQYKEEYLKATNSGLVFSVGGFTMKRLSELLDNNRNSLRKIKGYRGSGIDKDGLYVEADTPRGTFPRTLSGANLRVLPPGPTYEDAGTSDVAPVRPIVGGMAFSNYYSPPAGCTMSGTVLANGMPWLIFPAHCVPAPLCRQDSPHPLFRTSGNPLYNNNRYNFSQPEDFRKYQVINPPYYDTQVANDHPPYPIIGEASVWDNPLNHQRQTQGGTDVAAAALDDNSIYLDNSLAMAQFPLYSGDHTKREFEGSVITGANPNVGRQMIRGVAGVAPGMNIDIYTRDVANTGQYRKRALVTDINKDECTEVTFCGEFFYHCHNNSFRFRMLDPDRIQKGDSGSPVLTGGDLFTLPNYYVGFLSYGLFDPDHPDDIGKLGGGESYVEIVKALGIDMGRDPLYPTEIRSRKTNLAHAGTVELSVSTLPGPYAVSKPGLWACAIAAITNTGTKRAENVQIGFPDPFGNIRFGYYNAKNQWNTPQSIGPGKTKKFRACLLSTVATVPTKFRLNYWGDNAYLPVSKLGYNTFGVVWVNSSTQGFFLSADPTSTNDDVVHLNGLFGNNSFIIQAQNLGIAGSIVVTPNKTYVENLPLSTSICILDRVGISGQEECSLASTPNVTKTFATWEVARFKVTTFGTGTAIRLDPYYNRIGLSFTSGGQLRGDIGLSITTN